MQLAINAVILAVAFTVVTRLMQFRKAPLNRFIKKLRFLTNGFKLVTSTTEQVAALRSHGVKDTRSYSHAELLTRFVKYSFVVLVRLTCQ